MSNERKGLLFVIGCSLVACVSGLVAGSILFEDDFRMILLFVIFSAHLGAAIGAYGRK